MAAKKKKTPPNTSGIKIIARNKRARFDYLIEDRVEAGVVLLGSEVKSIRAGNISLNEAYASFIDEELFLMNANVSEYPWAHQFNHTPKRARKLLLHKIELARLAERVHIGGYSLIPTSVYFKKGRIKVEIGLGKGKKRFDKREDLKKKSAKRDVERVLRDR